MRKRKIVLIGKPIAVSLAYDVRTVRTNTTTVGRCLVKANVIHYPLHGSLAKGAKCNINR